MDIGGVHQNLLVSLLKKLADSLCQDRLADFDRHAPVQVEEDDAGRRPLFNGHRAPLKMAGGDVDAREL